jgi:hypothetical protein
METIQCCFNIDEGSHQDRRVGIKLTPPHLCHMAWIKGETWLVVRFVEMFKLFNLSFIAGFNNNLNNRWLLILWLFSFFLGNETYCSSYMYTICSSPLTCKYNIPSLNDSYWTSGEQNVAIFTSWQTSCW